MQMSNFNRMKHLTTILLFFLSVSIAFGANIFANRVGETTPTEGTGTVALVRAETGYQTFVSGVGSGNTCDYLIVNSAGQWEMGNGTVTDSAPDTLSRDTVESSSNSDALVNFSAGTKYVYCVLPASKMTEFKAAGDTRIKLSNYTDFATALSTIGSVTETDLWIDEDVTLAADATVTDNINLRFIAGNTISGAYTLTINGNITAGDFQIFGDSLIVAGTYAGYAKPIWFNEDFERAWDFTTLLILTPDHTYIIDGMSETESDVDIIGNGATLTVEAGGSGLRFYGGWEESQTVSAVASTHITVADASDYNVGDVLKIYNDEVLSFAKHLDPAEAESGRKGEFFIVNDIDAANEYVEFDKPLYLDYTIGSNNTTVVRIIKNSVKLSDFTINADVSTTDGQSTPLIRMEALCSPRVSNVNSHYQTDDQLFWVHSCFGGVFDRIECDYIVNAEYDADFTSNSGYGITFKNSEGCIVSNSIFKNCRHGTDGAGTYGASSSSGEATRHGSCKNNIITGCLGIRCRSSSFGWHHGSAQNTIVNCASYYSRDGGFGIRGLDQSVIGCSSNNDAYGIYLIVATDAETTCNVTGSQIYNPTRNAVRIESGATGIFNGLSVNYTEDSTITSMFDMDEGTKAVYKDLAVVVTSDLSAITSIFHIDYSATESSVLSVFDFTLDALVGTLYDEEWSTFAIANSGAISNTVFADNLQILVDGDSDQKYVFNAVPSTSSLIGRMLLLNDTDSGNIVNGVLDTASVNTGDINGPIQIGHDRVVYRFNSDTAIELSADPADPVEGSYVKWQSDGTGSGDDGDIMIKITSGGSTKTTTIIDFSGL